MKLIFPPLDWLDLLGLLILFLPIAIVIWLEILFKFIRKFGLENYRSVLSCSFLLFLIWVGFGSSSFYFYSRYQGEPASLELVWSAIDYSYGFSFVLFLALMPVVFIFYRGILVISEHHVKSETVQLLLITLLTIPSMVISYLMLESTWFGSHLFGIPVNLRQLLNAEPFSLLNDSPLRFTEIVGRLNTVLTAIGVIAWVSLVNNVLEFFSHLKEQKKATNQNK